MTAQAKKERPSYNIAVLKWARERKGMSIEDTAGRIQQRPERIYAWENGTETPTVAQARKLADIYDRSFLEFFSNVLPPVRDPQLVPDFRSHRGVDITADNVMLREVQEWAEAQRENALDLFDEIGERVVEFPSNLFCTTAMDVETAAFSARTAMDFPIERQMEMTSTESRNLPSILRIRIERLGVLTLKANEIKDFGARGICLAEFPLPVIIFGNEAPGAQAFTLTHELGHVMLKQSAVISPLSGESGVENWCDRFAAAFLMPLNAISQILGAVPARPAPVIADERIDSIAAVLRVSSHAMLIRLVHLGYVDPAYYWRVKKGHYEAQERSFKSFGRPAYYGSRYKSSLGDLYTGLVIEAWNSGRITNHNAAEYMGIKNLQHLYDIRERFGS